MKANEIQIGDWVEPSQCMIPTTYCKVKGIYPNGTVHLDKAERLFTLDELTPVYITPEILEKNGFKKSVEIDGGYNYYGNECTIFVFMSVIPMDTIYENSHDEEPLTATHISIEGCTFAIDMSIDYVHELQHALRLCGVEKEIEL